MNSYAEIDGVPVAANSGLLTEVLRDTWGFTGTVVSDYGAVAFLHLMHKVAGRWNKPALWRLQRASMWSCPRRCVTANRSWPRSRRAALTRIAVIGPCADDPQAFFGCYSFPNHVLPQYPDFQGNLGIEAKSLLTALRREFPAAESQLPARLRSCWWRPLQTGGRRRGG
jgi:beta-glucosidase-like glycosyl hydrolase